MRRGGITLLQTTFNNTFQKSTSSFSFIGPTSATPATNSNNVWNRLQEIKRYHSTHPHPHSNHNNAMPPGIKNIIAVSSAKGGVGKSTTAVNLAIALSSAQHKQVVGLLDADVYGPSIPIMLNLRHTKPAVSPSKKMIPLVNYGIKCMSMGFLVEEDTAMVWRGPMVMSAVNQMLHEVDWGALDILVVDLPPGTGDAVLTVCQRVPLTGAVVVSTPQDVALMDVVRGVNMFHKVNVPILGVVENMSYYQCSNCGHKEHLFGKEGAKLTAEKMGVPFLGDIPIDLEIRKTSDMGQPITITQPTSSSAQQYIKIANCILTRLTQLKQNPLPASTGPTIVIQ